MASNDSVKGGKYRGQPYHTLKSDRKYCGWLLHRADQSALPRTLLKTRNRLEKEAGGVLQCGMHKDCFFSEVVCKAPDYAFWAATLDDPGPMRDFTLWVKSNAAPDAEPANNGEPEKAQGNKASAENKNCVVCADKPIEAVFIPCGHLVTCLECAGLVVSQGCPMCRDDIQTYLKVFTT